MFDWFWRSVNDRLDAIEFKLDRTLNREWLVMAQQQDIADAIAVMRKDMSDQTTIVGGMSVFIAGIQKQLVDLANASKDTETASALMALAAQAESNTKSLSDAMAATRTIQTEARALAVASKDVWDETKAVMGLQGDWRYEGGMLYPIAATQTPAV